MRHSARSTTSGSRAAFSIRLVPFASAAEVDESIASARAAFPAWRDTPPAQRARSLFKYLQLLEDNKAEALSSCQDQGTKAELECALKAKNMEEIGKCHE